MLEVVNDTNYYFARLNITYPQTISKKELLETALNSAGESPSREGYKYSFLNVFEIKEGDHVFFTGELSKFKDTEISVADTKNKKDDIRQIGNLITSNSRFFLEVATGVLIFNTTKITIDVFGNKFIDLITKAHPDLQLDCAIYPILQEVNFKSSLKEFSIIKKIKITLHPSNPHSRPIWEDLDNRLQDGKITNYTEIIENRKDNESLNIENDTELEKKITMAVDGYGDAEGTGFKNGKKTTVTSRKKHASVKGPNSTFIAKDILDRIYPFFKQIYSRFNNENQ